MKLLISTKKIDNEKINSIGKYDKLVNMEELTNLAFDSYYYPTNSKMAEKYGIYKKKRKAELNKIIENEYMIQELWNIIYEY